MCIFQADVLGMGMHTAGSTCRPRAGLTGNLCPLLTPAAGFAPHVPSESLRVCSAWQDMWEIPKFHRDTSWLKTCTFYDCHIWIGNNFKVKKKQLEIN